MTTPARMRLLAGLLAGARDDASGPDDDPDTLRAAAVEQGVDALVWRQIEHATGHADALRAALYPGVRAAVAREIFVQQELQAMFTALDAAGIPVLVTKGTALAYAFYAEPWLRPRADTDLLVRRADVGAAADVLEARGYSRSVAISTGEHVSHQAAFERRDPNGVRHVIDLHWRIANPQVVAGALAFDALRAGSRGIP
ncbi:MAG TPA: nucleotidyltransferase family protein, partial [Gemmatimonadales bacterium]|nr:nucleotidyltransferase family protein [Gemmatimonadales bacterium]